MKTLQKTLRKTLTREEFIEKFYNKSKSSGSKNVLISTLKIFDGFCSKVYGNDSERLLDKLRGDTSDALYHFLQDFINYMGDKNLKPNLLHLFSTLRTYLRSQGIKISSDDVKDLISLPNIIQELRIPLTKDHLKLLLDYSKPDRKALYLTLLSSGMRIGEGLYWTYAYLKQYLRKDPIKRAEMFSETEPALTIFRKSQQNLDSEKLQS